MNALKTWSKHNWLLYVVAVAYVALAVLHPAQAAEAALRGLMTFVRLVPTLLMVFALIGLVRTWVTEAFIMRHLGEDSGWRGIVIGAGLGTIVIGPLVGIFPLYESLLVKGARAGVIVAMVSTWAIKLAMIPLELSIFGWQFTLVRNGLLFCSAFLMAPLMERVIGKDWADRFRVVPAEE